MSLKRLQDNDTDKKSSDVDKVDFKKKRIKSNLFVFSIIFGIFYAYIFITNSGTKCFTKSITGVPCPSCGMTRSYVHLFNFEFLEAFHDHPLFITIPLIILTILLLQKYRKNRKLVKLLSGFLILMIVLFIGVYIYRMIIYFPHTDPLKYYEQGIIPRVFRKIQEFFGK